MRPELEKIVEDIRQRSAVTRSAYEAAMQQQARELPPRAVLSCGNLAHGLAACPAVDQARGRSEHMINLGIVTAYNDVLSAHQPYERYPELIRKHARARGAMAQVAGGVPAMCDGVTQGQPGMDLSLMSRDVIAMSTAIALTHNMFDAALCLGICDKIVPGLLMGALSFGHLPVLFIPSGPMPTGISNAEKQRVRQQYAQGLVDELALFDMEQSAYHSPGTCTFYGTANSNQMLLEAMGLQLPGASFVPPDSPVRDALTRHAVDRALQKPYALYEILGVDAIVNAMIVLLATGGSTNHTIHLVAIARQAGVLIDWTDFSRLSALIPLLARVYPNGEADVNQFHQAGGTTWVMRELLAAGLLCDNVKTIMGEGLSAYTKAPALRDGEVVWEDIPAQTIAPKILAGCVAPFSAEGGLKLLEGNLGRAIIKVSAVKPEHRRVRAPARVFADQHAVMAAFDRGELNQDGVIVVRCQGPKANGMPELHQLTPILGTLQERGHSVALLTDGRMSGASGKVPAAIHLTPEAVDGGLIAQIRDGDIILLDAEAGVLQLDAATRMTSPTETPTIADDPASSLLGRGLFAPQRRQLGTAEQGASFLGTPWS